eukprot:TRINITY_DN21774_c0_g1_i2.p1 TRINITY_DN21774_c0_g1~~TRINITY_DN21774_c0_g1_i2.p1  ORF type:complete len:145 (+),score=19.71 TRINITY_DN21774_c0_g1_i2:349-783(+)
MPAQQIKHLLHELWCFVHSGMDSELWDNSVSYESGSQAAEQALLAHNSAVCSEVPLAPAQRMMHSMGWRQGQGLGKESDGRPHPIEPQQNKRRAGLGSNSLPYVPPSRPKVNTRFLQNTLNSQAHEDNRERRKRDKMKGSRRSR